MIFQQTARSYSLLRKSKGEQMTFLDKDFLLTTDTAKILFHEHAEKMPIIDYHCHLDTKDIY